MEILQHTTMNATVLIGKKVDGNTENDLTWVLRVELRQLNFNLWLITIFIWLGCGGIRVL